MRSRARTSFHGSARSRTVSRHSANEPRGVRRGPSGPCAIDLLGLAAPADRLHDLAPQAHDPALARRVEAQRRARRSSVRPRAGRASGGGSCAPSCTCTSASSRCGEPGRRARCAQPGCTSSAARGMPSSGTISASSPRFSRSAGDSRITISATSAPTASARTISVRSHAARAIARLALARGERLHGGRDHLRHHVDGHADGVGHLARRHVVAGEHAPQAAADDDGHAHRRAHAHVLQVLDVDRRDAAQHAVAQVQRLALRGVGHQRHRLVADVGDQAQRVEDVQAARLGRDVAGRIAPAQVGLERVAAGLGDDVAAVVVAEAVGHHAVEAGQLAHRDDGGVEQAVDRALALERVHRAVGQVREGRHLAGVGRAALELAEDAARAAHAARRRRSASPTRVSSESVTSSSLLASASASWSSLRERGVVAERVRAQRAAEVQRQAQQRGHVGARVAQAAEAVEREQGAVRLDRPRDVDRLAIAVLERQLGRGRRQGHRRHFNIKSVHSSPTGACRRRLPSRARRHGCARRRARQSGMPQRVAVVLVEFAERLEFFQRDFQHRVAFGFVDVEVDVRRRPAAPGGWTSGSSVA